MMNKAESIIKFLLVLCVIQVVFTILFAIRVFLTTSAKSPMDLAQDYNTDYEEFNGIDVDNQELVIDTIDKGNDNSWLMKKLDEDALPNIGPWPIIEVWSKAAIGSYLWHHILKGTSIQDPSNPSIDIGHLNASSLQFVYRDGPGLMVGTAPKINYLVLVINGRSDEKINTSWQWLDYLSSLDNPPDTILVVLGNENCVNDWLFEYADNVGYIKAVFLTYDDPKIDDIKYFQWPLGVATYRMFPDLDKDLVELDKERKYICNFQMTVHKNSSRVALLHTLHNLPDKQMCFVAGRMKWSPNESPESMNDYIYSLIQSDLTLCPSGFNPETYRVYEALACGSIPVIEDSRGRGKCDSTSWRLLKKYNPPVIWIKNWNDVEYVLNKCQKRTLESKVKRRETVFEWYKSFKEEMKGRFIKTIKDKFNL